MMTIEGTELFRGRTIEDAGRIVQSQRLGRNSTRHYGVARHLKAHTLEQYLCHARERVAFEPAVVGGRISSFLHSYSRSVFFGLTDLADAIRSVAGALKACDV